MSKVIVQPQGEYATVDTSLVRATMASLQAPQSAEELQATIDAVRANPQKYAPPAFYVLSHALFAQNQCDDAAFWFYAGQLRARYDATRCADATAGSAVDVLNDNYGTPINQYMFQRPTELKALIPKVLEFDAKTPHEYDHRWINLHGMGAIMNKEGALSLPEERWPELEQLNRDNYLRGFTMAMANFIVN